ncbi:MAG: hypothetical protein M0R17_07555 [Candidatus Omnitrophica bacterium]|jgi:hypothetical protein|nr:hypothetical protein [Candidatus Omnitrophota bacterium]
MSIPIFTTYYRPDYILNQIFVTGSASVPPQINAYFRPDAVLNFVYVTGSTPAIAVNIINSGSINGGSAGIPYGAGLVVLTGSISADQTFVTVTGFITGSNEALTGSINNMSASLQQVSSSYVITSGSYITLSSSYANLSKSYQNTSKYLVNRYYVGPSGSFQTIQNAVAFLTTGSNMSTSVELLLDGGNHPITDTVTVNLTYPLSIRGLANGCTIVQASTGLTNKPMFNINTDVYIEKIKFDGSTLSNYGSISTENCLNINSKYVDIENIIINGFYNQVNIVNSASIFFFNSICSLASHSAICVNSSESTTIDVETNTFDNCNNIINLSSSVSGSYDLVNNLFNNPPGSTAIIYNTTSYHATGFSSIFGNRWNNVGTFFNGYDFTRTDRRDSNIYIKSNNGIEDKVPHFKVNVVDNVLTSSVTTASVFVKANYTISSSYVCNVEISGSKFVYQPTNASDAYVWVTGNLNINKPNQTCTVCLRKNTNTSNISPMTVRTSTVGQPVSFALIIYLSSMTAGDYTEIYVTSDNTGDITIQDMNIFGRTL